MPAPKGDVTTVKAPKYDGLEALLDLYGEEADETAGVESLAWDDTEMLNRLKEREMSDEAFLDALGFILPGQEAQS